jgi:type IV pilus assembly protein PilA
MTSMKSTKVQNEGKKDMRKQQKGFSLIELLIVVAIILIIAAIAIPNLMRARMAANDSSAAASEHTIIVGEVGYLGAYPALGYGTLAQLGGGASPCVPAPATGCLIDNNLATNGGALGKSGYTFASIPGGTALTGWNFYTTAAPLSNVTGTKAFCAVDDGVVRVAAPGVIIAPAGYGACQGLTPMQN